MNARQQAALRGFADAVKELKDAGVTRSHRYLGDIAEFLCAFAFDIDLATNLRQVGHDGHRANIPVQIKYGGGKKKNVDLGDPTQYQEVYVVLGEGSVLRPDDHEEDFVIYKFTSEEVSKKWKTALGYSCGAEPFKREPDGVISLEDVTR